MPRGIPNKKPAATNGEAATTEQPPLERALSDVKTMLETRKTEYAVAIERIDDILASMNPQPRIGRPPKGTT